MSWVFKKVNIGVTVFFMVGWSQVASSKPPAIFETLDQLAYDQPEQALQAIKQTTFEQKAADHELWLQVIEGKALYHLNRFADSQSLLIQVETATEEQQPNPLQEMTHRLMGQNYYRMGGFDLAMSHALKALLLAEEQGLQWEQAQVTNMVAAIHLRSGDFVLAREHFIAALSYFESVNSTVDVAKLKNNLGALYIETGSYDLAAQNLSMALNLAIDLNRATTIISVLVNQIELYVKMQDFGQAQVVYETCLAHAAKAHLSSFEVWCLEAGAEMYQRQGSQQQATVAARQAYDMAGQQKLHQSRINLGKVLVELYSEGEQYQQALLVSSENLTQVESIKDEVLKLKLDEVRALNDIERTRSQLQFERRQNQLYLKNQRLTWIGLAILIPVLLVALLLLRSKQRLVQALHSQQQDTADALEKMRQAKEVNEQLAKTDALTGLLNRRAISQEMGAVCVQSEQKDAYCVLMIDVDRFKQVNDQYGHAVGDAVLIKLAATLQELMPDGALTARWGGEEFLVLLAHTDVKRAEQIATHFLKTMAEQVIDPHHQISITVSIGLSQLKSNQTMDAWINQADQALYASKNNGRNQVTVV